MQLAIMVDGCAFFRENRSNLNYQWIINSESNAHDLACRGVLGFSHHLLLSTVWSQSRMLRFFFNAGNDFVLVLTISFMPVCWCCIRWCVNKAKARQHYLHYVNCKKSIRFVNRESTIICSEYKLFLFGCWFMLIHIG